MNDKLFCFKYFILDSNFNFTFVGNHVEFDLGILPNLAGIAACHGPNWCTSQNRHDNKHSTLKNGLVDSRPRSVKFVVAMVMELVERRTSWPTMSS